MDATKLNPNQVLVTEGRYEECDKATSTSGTVSNLLFSNHEEARYEDFATMPTMQPNHGFGLSDCRAIQRHRCVSFASKNVSRN
ncbi:hypothetical protein JTE90_017647 [Oedothorax gibbosus]|uniref:Uncharacterized protein n=1 Tax=Oedothorax gibbosus TaxID=931172 RepID=A0AAV6TGV8_9ARAC|nr:hypothetical protein JTE90_017647 [Oedothorax gibbosus]